MSRYLDANTLTINYYSIKALQQHTWSSSGEITTLTSKYSSVLRKTDTEYSSMKCQVCC